MTLESLASLLAHAATQVPPTTEVWLGAGWETATDGGGHSLFAPVHDLILDRHSDPSGRALVCLHNYTPTHHGTQLPAQS